MHTTEFDWQLSPGEQLLCHCLQSHDEDLRRKSAHQLLSTLGEPAARELATEHEVGSLVAHALGDTATSWWRAAHERVEETMNAYLAELDFVADLLATAGVPLVALKNAGIARGLYACRGCCPMGDLDVMVRRSDFVAAHRLLSSEGGYAFEFRSHLEDNNLAEAERSGGSEYWKILATGEKLWLELQWRPVAGRWIRHDQEPSCDDLMERSLPISGTKVRLLSPEDNLLQVALHTAKHTYVRAPGLRLHTDVDRIVCSQPIDWQRFVTMVRQSRLRTAVYFSLLIPACIFSTPIPPTVLRDLAPAATKKSMIASWIRQAGLLHPQQQKFSRIRYIAFNMMLFDDLNGVARGIFPSPAWMLSRYERKSAWELPLLYLRRIFDLVFRRANT